MMHSSGSCAQRFAPVRAAFEANFDEGHEIGASFAAFLDGENIIDLWGGHMDVARAKPWAEDTVAPVYSTTKAAAALTAALLVERGVLDYEAPVAAYWPQFAAAGKGALTLGQMLSHQGGLPGFVEPIDTSLWLDPETLAAHLASLPPLWPPGTRNGYHPLTWGYMIGEVVRRAAGRSLGAVLRDEICAPAGIDFRIGAAAQLRERTAEIRRPASVADLGAMNEAKRAAFGTKWAQPDRGGPEWRDAEIPSANGHGNARSVARLFRAFAEGGAIGPLRLFGAATFEALTRSRIKGEDLVLPFAIDWAAGVMRNSNLWYGPNPNALGHSGWGGSFGMGDPDARLSCAYVMNRQSHFLVADPRAVRLIEAVYSCL